MKSNSCIYCKVGNVHENDNRCANCGKINPPIYDMETISPDDLKKLSILIVEADQGTGAFSSDAMTAALIQMKIADKEGAFICGLPKKIDENIIELMELIG